MKKYRFFKCIVSTISCLTFICSFPSSQMISFADDTPADVEYYSTFDANSDTYQEWKTQIASNQETAPKTKLRSTITTNGIKNEFLELYYKNGIYSLGTVEGDPTLSTDNNKRLLYGFPEGGTSFTTIRIDGENYKFTPANVSYTENIISASAVYDDVSVTLNFSLITNQYTGREDVAEFSYNVKNIGTASHNVGVRIMFDTMLGGNDSSPFRIPNVGDTSLETDLSGDDVPEFWQSFDSLTKPNVIAQGTIKSSSSMIPDRVRFTNWRSAYNNYWDYSRAAGAANGDSAVCIYWNPKKLSSGDNYNCKTFYGLSSLQQDGTPPLAVALTGATKLEVEHNEIESDTYNPNPFTVTAYIQNIGDGDAHDVTARLNLPSNMSIVEGKETVDLGDLAVNSNQRQVSWKVWVEPNAISSIKSYSVTVAAANADTKTLQRNIEVPALQTNGPLKLYFDRNRINNNSNNLELDFKLVNSSNATIDLNNYIARYYFIDETPDSNKIIDIYYCGNQYNNSVNVNASYHSIPAPYKNNANAYLEFDFSKSNITLDMAEDLRVYSAMHSSNWSSINILNDFSAIDSNYNDENGLILWTKMPIYEISSGKKVWGTEPKDASEVSVPTMSISCLANTINNDSIVDMIITLKNTSTTPIYLSNSELTYYYMNDNDYVQNVYIYYAGGKINDDWISITDKISGEATLLETKKDRANSKIKLLFSSISGALCYNESIDIHLQLSNQNWAQGKFNLENDYSYSGITDTNYIANNILFTANYLNNNGEYAGYEYGEPIGDYHPTFSAFKIGEGKAGVNTLDDYNNFINYFSTDFGGVPYNEYATAENITNNNPNSSLDDFNFNNENLKALLASDIAYISGHGSRGGVIPIYPNGIRSVYSSGDEEIDNNIYEMLYSQIITTDKNVGIDFQNFGLFDSARKLNINNGEFISNFYNGRNGINDNNIFSINMKDHANDGITENLQWIITGACSQVNKQKEGDPIADTSERKALSASSTDRWVDVLVNNKNLKGVLGYHGQAPSADAAKPDYQVIDDFLNYCSPEHSDYERSTIHDAWIKANAFYSKILPDTLPCGLIVKEHYDEDFLYDSLISTDEVSCDYIYRYTARYVVVASISDKDIGYVSYDDEMIIPNAVNAIRRYYGSAIDDNSISDEIMAIDRECFSNTGEFIASNIDEYIFNVSVDNNSTSKKMVKKSNTSISKLVRYCPETDTVEELI